MNSNKSLSCPFPRGFGHFFLMALVMAVVVTGFAENEINLSGRWTVDKGVMEITQKGNPIKGVLVKVAPNYQQRDGWKKGEMVFRGEMKGRKILGKYNKHETKLHRENSAAYFGYLPGQNLVGTWHLTAEIVAGITNPFSGRILNIDTQGLFDEDFSTTTSPRAPECSTVGKNFGSYEALTSSLSDYVIDGFPSPGIGVDPGPIELTPDEMNKLEQALTGLTDEQKQNFYARLLNVTAQVPQNVSFFTDQDQANILKIRVFRNHPLNLKVKLTCPGADVDATSTGATSKLGTGVALEALGQVANPASDPDQVFVPYLYGFTPDGNTLVIQTINGPLVNWIFERQ